MPRPGLVAIKQLVRRKAGGVHLQTFWVKPAQALAAARHASQGGHAGRFVAGQDVSQLSPEHRAHELTTGKAAYERDKQTLADRAEKGGRYVPDHVVKGAYEGIPKNVQAIANKADSFKLFDNMPKGGRLVYEKTAEGQHVDHDPEFMKNFRYNHLQNPG